MDLNDRVLVGHVHSKFLLVHGVKWMIVCRHEVGDEGDDVLLGLWKDKCGQPDCVGGMVNSLVVWLASFVLRI